MAKSKGECQLQHAKKRAYERLGIEMSTADICSIIRQIQAGKARFIERQSNRVTVFEISVVGNDVLVLYDSSRKTIITFLTHSMV